MEEKLIKKNLKLEKKNSVEWQKSGIIGRIKKCKRGQAESNDC